MEIKQILSIFIQAQRQRELSVKLTLIMGFNQPILQL